MLSKISTLKYSLKKNFNFERFQREILKVFQILYDNIHRRYYVKTERNDKYHHTLLAVSGAIGVDLSILINFDDGYTILS